MLQSVTPGLYVSPGIIGPGSNIAAFDLDWTIIRTVRGRFPKDADDWAFLPNRLSVLKSYRDAGYTIVIFTNQGYTGAKLQSALTRINNVNDAFSKDGISAWVFVSTLKDNYRKPEIGMWTVFEQYMTHYQKVINKEASFYIGDAAGRPGDFENTDLLFANNIGIPFFVPEQIFPENTVEIPNTQTMFIFVGMPGSGKTSFYNQHLQPRGWIHANQDILKTQPKMIKTVREALQAGKSVAIDATNGTIDKRKQYIMMAFEFKVPTLIIYFVSNGYERNKLRQKPVPDIAYNVYYKNLVEPDPNIDHVPVIQIA